MAKAIESMKDLDSQDPAQIKKFIQQLAKRYEMTLMDAIDADIHVGFTDHFAFMQMTLEHFIDMENDAAEYEATK